MTDNPHEPIQTIQLTVLLTGTDKQVTQVARELTKACERAGVRYVLEQRAPAGDESKLFEGEHRL